MQIWDLLLVNWSQLPMRHEQMITEKIKSLLKVHDQRIKRLELGYLAKRKLRDEAREALEQRLASIANLKAKHSGVFRYLGQQQVLSKPLCHERAHTHRYWLEYDLEKDEYYLDMDREALAEAEAAMDEARKEWLLARARKSGVEKLLNMQHQRNELLAEYRQELDEEESLYNRLEDI